MTGISREKTVPQERDEHLLRELDKVMRVIDREQAKEVAGFGSTTRANARLLKLTRASYLKRARIGTIAGGLKSVYTLGKRGEALVGATRPGLSFRKSTSLAGTNLEHQLQINEVFLTVKYRPIPLPGVRFLTWQAFVKSLSPIAPIIPDGYLELEQADQIHPVFLEVDLGTERLGIWREKVRSYLRLAISGEFQRLFGRDRFRVLVLTTTNRRLLSLRREIANATRKIFWLSTFEQVTSTGFWSPCWLRPQGGEKLPLF